MERKALLKSNQASSADRMRSISYHDTRARSIRKACSLKSLKHFCEEAFLINLARVCLKNIDLILSAEDAWLFFKSNFLTILNKHAPFKKM